MDDETKNDDELAALVGASRLPDAVVDDFADRLRAMELTPQQGYDLIMRVAGRIRLPMKDGDKVCAVTAVDVQVRCVRPVDRFCITVKAASAVEIGAHEGQARSVDEAVGRVQKETP